MIGKGICWSREEELWRAFQEGNELAFAQLYERYADTLFQYCSRFTTDRDLVKDCIHDLFVELWRTRKTLSATTSVRFYLLACIKRKVLRQLQKHQSNIAAEQVSQNQMAATSYEALLIKDQEGQQLHKELQQAMDHLTKRQREAIFLKFYQNLPYEQIAVLMGVNAQSVYNLIFGALRELKKRISIENILLSLLLVGW